MTNSNSNLTAVVLSELQDEFRNQVLAQTEESTNLRKVCVDSLSYDDMVYWYNFFKGELELLQLQ